MQNFNKISLIAIILVFLAGIIIGQGFSFEVKLSDLITMVATLVTFTFAYKGLKSNTEQYLYSTRPLLIKYELVNNANLKYTLSIENVGNGTSLNRSIDIQHDDNLYALEDFMEYIRSNFKFNVLSKFSSPSAVTAGGKDIVIEIETNNKATFDQIYSILQKSQLQLSYESLNREVFNESFNLGLKPLD